MLDVGAGSARWSLDLARADAGTRVTAVDLPEQVDALAQAIEQAGMSARYRVIAGDVLGDGLAGLGPFDIAVVANVCHLFDEPKNLRMLERVAGTLAPGGVLAIVDQVLDDDPDWARWSALYVLGVLHCAPAAHLFTARTYLAWMRACGLRDATARPLSALPPLTLVSARR